MPILMVGDADQCLISGQKVATPQGYKPIETIQKYDKVISALGSGQTGYRFVTNISSRFATNEPVVTIETESGKLLKVTYNHVVFASIAGRSHHTKYLSPDLHFVYIMYKRGLGYRIGTTKNPLTRLRSESGDALWLIRSYDNITQALYDENLLSFRYGIPTTVFNDRSGKSHETKYLTQPWINKLFSEIDTESAIKVFSKDEAFLFDMPHIVPQSDDSRVSVRFEMCKESPNPIKRKKNPSHLLSIETSHQNSIEKILDAGFDLTASKKGKRIRLRGKDAKSLEVKAKQLNDMLDGNLIIKGCFVSVENLEANYSLVPQAMPAGNVLPGFYVPVLQENNTITLDKVISVSKESYQGQVYDLEVMDTANFIAEGLVVHNCIYRFTGAKPEILTEMINNLIPDIRTVKLHTNYRSTQAIVQAQLDLIEHNYSAKGGPYSQELVKTLEARPNAPEGEKIAFAMYDTPQEEASALVEELTILLQQYEPQDVFIASRTRAQLGYLEGPLVRAKIPFINITGGSFWGSKHVQDVIAYVKLAYNNADNKAFARVYDIGSRYNEYNYTDRKGRFSKGDYSPKRWLGKQFLAACDSQYKNIYKALQSSNGWRWKSGIEDLESLLDIINFALAEGGIKQALRTVIDECYKDYLVTTDEIQEGESSKLDDLETVVDMANTFEDAEAFFNYVDECVQTAEDAKNGDWSKHVILSTTHRLKGLERAIIFGIGLCEGVDEEGEPVGLLPHTYSMQYPPQFGILPSGGMGRVEDERCLAFVLVSRGKEKVILSGVRQYQKLVNLLPSRFIKEIGLF